MPNHFHLVIRVKDVIFFKDDNPKLIKDEAEVGAFVSNQFRKMFVAYSMAINKQENRTGNLFDRSFKRLEIREQEYLQYAIFYVHYNPQKHGAANDFRKSAFSSYRTLISQQQTKLSLDLVFEIFDGKDAFVNYHQVMHEEREPVILD